VAWSAREVRSVSHTPPFTPVHSSSLSSPSAGTAWERRHPGFPIFYQNHRVCRAPRRYVVLGRRDAFLLEGVAKSKAFTMRIQNTKFERFWMQIMLFFFLDENTEKLTKLFKIETFKDLKKRLLKKHTNDQRLHNRI